MVNYFEGAQRCQVNGDRLYALADVVHKNAGDFPLASFLWDTSSEEHLKGLFSVFVHYGWLNPEVIETALFTHAPKVKLNAAMLAGVTIVGGIGGPMQCNGQTIVTLNDLPGDHTDYRAYMDQRNDSLYVSLDTTTEGWQNPHDLQYADIAMEKRGSVGLTSKLLKRFITEDMGKYREIQFKHESKGGVHGLSVYTRL